MALDADGNEIQDIDGNDDPNNVTETEAQKLRSWMGRIEAGQKEDRTAFKAAIEKIGEITPAPVVPTFGNEPQDQLNSKLHEMILDGDPDGAFKLWAGIQEKAKSSLKAHSDKRLATALGAITDDPVMKNADLSGQVSEMAAKLVGEGYDPNAAVSFAKTTVENTALRGMIQSGATGQGALEMLGGGSGGKPPASTHKGWPQQFEDAYQRDKAGGYFKNRAEYIEATLPEIREKYGIK